MYKAVPPPTPPQLFPWRLVRPHPLIGRPWQWCSYFCRKRITTLKANLNISLANREFISDVWVCDFFWSLLDGKTLQIQLEPPRPLSASTRREGNSARSPSLFVLSYVLRHTHCGHDDSPIGSQLGKRRQAGRLRGAWLASRCGKKRVCPPGPFWRLISEVVSLFPRYAETAPLLRGDDVHRKGRTGRVRFWSPVPSR